MDPVHILLVSGSLRSGSTNSALVRTAVAVAPEGVSTEVYDGLAGLPHFNPDDDADGASPAAPVAAMRERFEAADAVLFSTPEYAGALPGSFKNLLEWTVGCMAMYEKPAAWINVAAPGRGGNADDSLRKVLGYINADVAEEACVKLPMDRDAIGPAGEVDDPGYRAGVAAALGALAGHVRRGREESGVEPTSSAGRG
jgi:chromate reductase, NAD(P)H dehydrogenase (quinone)